MIGIAGFTLIEILIAISLASIVVGIGLSGVMYFSAESKLAEAREVLETLLISTNSNALTGKSYNAEYYAVSSGSIGSQQSKLFIVTRYFLYFKKMPTWDEPGEIIYGELSKNLNGLSTKGAEKTDDVYKIVYIQKKKIPFPVYLRTIYFQEAADATCGVRTELQKDLVLFFDPPFGTVSFAPDQDLSIMRDGVAEKPLAEITQGDLGGGRYLILPRTGTAIDPAFTKKGVAEFVLQYKDREYTGDDAETNDEHFWLQEYVKYDSHNQLANEVERCGE